MSQSNTENLLIYNARKASNPTMWILFLFLGWSYGSLGNMVKQVFYYLTFGGLGLWALYRLFTLNGAIKKAKDSNLNAADLSEISEGSDQ